VTQWSADKFTRGCYSFIAVGGDADNLRNMAEPLPENGGDGDVGFPPRVLFAGEATHEHFFSTMHGAYESGVREATRVLFHNRNKQQPQH